MGDLYKLELRHRAQPNESFKERHRAFTQVMSRYDRPFGYKGLETPEAPDIAPGDLSSVVQLRALSGRGRRSFVNYQFRSKDYLKDKAQYDDIVIIEFDSNKVDSEALFGEVFPAYVDAFDCYRASIANREITAGDWDNIVEICESTGRDANGRDGVYRFHPANYFDRELCRRAFGLSPEKIIERLEGKVEKVSLFNDGVLLVWASAFPSSEEEYLKIDHEIKAILK